MRRAAWLLSSVALLPLLAHAAGNGWGAGGGSVAVDTAARTAAAAAMALAQGSAQQTRNLSDLANSTAALGNLGGIPASMIGAPSGVAGLGANKLLSAAQIPFGTTAGTVADGGRLATTAATASAAVPSSMIGAPSGVAGLGANKLLSAAQIPFGTAAGTVADGGALAATAATASAAVPSSMIGAPSGVAGLGANKLLSAAQIPFGTTAGTVADGGALATTAATASAAVPSSMIGASSGVAGLGANKLLSAAQIPFGTTAGTVADGGALAATAATASAAVPSSMIGASSGVAGLGANKLLSAAQIPFGTAAGTVADGGTLAATAATANAAVPTSMLGAASGIAMLDGNKLLLTSQIPFGTNAGQVAPNSLIASIQSTASGAVQAGSSTTAGSDISFTTLVVNGVKTGIQTMLQSMVTGTSSYGDILAGYTGNTVFSVAGDTMARSISAWAGDVYNVADHGADGTAADDDAAVVKAFAYARLHPGTHVRWPMGTFPMLATAGQTYLIPSDTSLEGSSQFVTDITWNDANTGDIPTSYTQGCQAYVAANPGKYCQYGLFTSDRSQLGTGRARNIAVHHMRFTGSWGSTDSNAATFAPAGYGGQVLELDNVDGVDVSESYFEHSRSFGPYINNSSDVSVHANFLNYMATDAIPVWASSNVHIWGNIIQHGNDDCISAHDNVYGGVWTARRDIDIEGNSCFDTSAIDVASARYAVISGNTITAPRGNAISVDTAPANTNGTTQGDSSSVGVIISNNLITDLVARTVVDNYNGNNAYITIDGHSARPGQYAAIPGETAAGVSHGQDPAPEFFANATASTVAIGESHAFMISHNYIGTNLPSFNGSDSRFKSWTDFGEGPFVSNSGEQNPTATQAAAFGSGVGLFFEGGAMRDVGVDDNDFEGMKTPIAFSPGTYADIHVDRNTFFNWAQYAIYVSNPGAVTDITIDDNDFDGDPYVLNGCRGGSGNWNGTDCLDGVLIDNGTVGVTVLRNKFKNVSDATNVSTSAGTGNTFADNIEYADLNRFWPNTSVDADNILNVGMRYVRTAGFHIVGMHGDPTQANFGTLFSTPIDGAPAAPASGFFYPGDYVRNTAPAAATPTLPPIAGWKRLTLGPRNLLGFDWAPDYIGGAAPVAKLMQTAAVRNPDSGTSATIAFANPVQAADAVIVTMAGGSNNVNATMPSSCVLLAGPGVLGYSVAGNQSYKVWQCPSGITYAVSSLADGAIVEGMEIANYQSALVAAAPVAQSTTTLTVPATGSPGDLRLGVVEWDGAATTVAVVPATIPITNFPAGSDSYHYGFTYSLPAGATGASFTATTGYTVAAPTYVQIDIQSKPSVNLQSSAYTFTQADCDTWVRDLGATAAHSYTVPYGLAPKCRIDIYQETANAITINAATGVTVRSLSGGTTTTGAGDHRVIDVLDPATVAVHQ